MPRSKKKTSSALVLGALLTALLSLLLPAPSALASGDDYPYRTQTNTIAADPWGFTERQCVSFVAWRLRQHSHPLNNYTQHWGSAYHWDTAAVNLHKLITHIPKVGAIAQWNQYESSKYYAPSGGIGTITAGPAGHVAYVSRVYTDGSVQIEQYNMFGSRSYSIMHVKAPRYIYAY